MQEEKDKQEEILKSYVESQEEAHVGPPIIPTPDVQLPWQKNPMPIGNQIGWIPQKIADLPTRGLFYPANVVIAIRSANGGEIRHWSTLVEDPNDPRYLSNLDDMLNYIIERCVTIKSNDANGGYLSWKDIKEVDRFYLLLAIHELTFPNGENKLQVKISDTKKIDVIKDMVNYISLDPNLMQYYDETERCFVLKLKGGRILKLDIPSVGVTQWLKHYVMRKQQMQEFIEEDYLAYAPFIIRSWKGLNEDSYNKYVEESNTWDVKIVSLLSYVKQNFADAIDPVIKFLDEGGIEQTAPLNFQGGIKSIFIIPDPFRELE